ncbi:DUF3558 domain-containing protein [Amycolatopsis azurea]|uniref:DUF3558 domain-containing protein n=1 Tax=Amycolatopsis azurea DSM 43854 TaxID=1238180 RepID=A0ABX3JE07_9PSEU|nr:DUF3558 domain-containing protein [Amycolatopsis azurea]OOC05134.1 hypothetical protein B0293_19640 [Amycolatopsis azurea DSM 43854]
MRRKILLISAVAIALAACSPPSTDGTPAPTSSGMNPSPSSTVGQLPGPGVPKVDHPIDLAQIKQTPCKALTAAQIDELFGQAMEAKPRDGAAGPACRWTPPSDTRPRVDVVFDSSTKRGLTAVYEAKGKAYKFVEPLPAVDGYPLVAFGVEDERATEGRCLVSIGTSDNEVISLAVEQSKANIGDKDPCDAARQAAIRVLATIRGGN